MRSIATCVLLLVSAAAAADWRDITTGRVVPTEAYCDQPYMVVRPNGDWLCMVTTGPILEGRPGNRTVATVSKDQGRTWSKLVDCNEIYAVPFQTPSGRIYSLTAVYMTYSDDGGQTWSSRSEIPVRLSIFGNEKRRGWTVALPYPFRGSVYLPWAIFKLQGLDRSASFLFRSPNLLTEGDPARIVWETLPGSGTGLRVAQEAIAEEPHVVALPDGTLYCVFRTLAGYIGHSTSRDDGVTWSEPQFLTYGQGRGRIKNPRACSMLWDTGSGRYLLWYHNNSHIGFRGRDVVWISGGLAKAGRIEWSEPEVLLYSDNFKNEGRGPSYPGLVRKDGRYWIAETQKTATRIHEVDTSLLEGMWNQGSASKSVTRGLLLSLNEKQLRAKQWKAPRFPNLAGGGFSIDLRVHMSGLAPGQHLLDTRDGGGKGILLETGERGTIRLALADGTARMQWESDPGLLKESGIHHLTVTVDRGPGLVTFVVDGVLCDGGTSRTHGWTRFSSRLADVNGAARMLIAPSFRGKLLSLRIYGRYLRTSEAVANYQAKR
jgi:hypothetical protein